MLSKVRESVSNVFFIILGTTLIAIPLNVFFEPNRLVNGGITGLGIIILNLSRALLPFEIPVFVTNLAVNLPLLVIAYFVFGRQFAIKTVFATVFLSFALIYTSFLPNFSGDLLLASLYGGILSGAGVAFVIKGYATTGGTELIAMLLNKVFSHIPISKLIFFVDAVIISLGFLVFGLEKALYAIISVFVGSKIVAVILEGMNFAIATFIISKKSDEISEKILTDVGRGVTFLYGMGGYSKTEFNVLLCVLSKKEIGYVKRLAGEIDPAAFVILADVREVLGEGFGPQV